MRRYGPILLVVALLAGTAAAFAVAEHVKLEKSPLIGPSVDPVFSPVCECPNSVAQISFRLSRADTIGIGIVDSHNHLVRTLVADRRYPPLHRLEFEWNGRTADRAIAPDGAYHPRVHFADRDRTIVLPNTIHLDTSPPEVAPRGVRPRVFSPDGDGRADGIAVRYHVNEHPARVLLLVDGIRRVRGKLRDKTDSQLQWYGRAGGESYPAGTYRLSFLAEDKAGNVSRPVPAGSVRIRYIDVTPRIVHVRKGARFRIQVDTDARSYSWRFAGRSGLATGKAIVFTARHAGQFAVVLEESGHKARVGVLVTK
jgi:hypothetical protein